jgi:hypothetical protein
MLTLAAGAVVYRRPMLVREEHARSGAGAASGEEH